MLRCCVKKGRTTDLLRKTKRSFFHSKSKKGGPKVVCCPAQAERERVGYYLRTQDVIGDSGSGLRSAIGDLWSLKENRPFLEKRGPTVDRVLGEEKGRLRLLAERGVSGALKQTDGAGNSFSRASGSCRPRMEEGQRQDCYTPRRTEQKEEPQRTSRKRKTPMKKQRERSQPPEGLRTRVQ